MNQVSDCRHTFVRVEEGKPVEHLKLQSTVNVNGQVFTVNTPFPFEQSLEIMKALERAEAKLAMAVGQQLIMGQSPVKKK